jgi:hypothetical protein
MFYSFLPHERFVAQSNDGLQVSEVGAVLAGGFEGVNPYLISHVPFGWQVLHDHINWEKPCFPFGSSFHEKDVCIRQPLRGGNSGGNRFEVNETLHMAIGTMLNSIFVKGF